MIEECKSKNNYTDLNKRVIEVFSNIDALNLSFMKDSNIYNFVNEDNHFIDMDELSQFYLALDQANKG